MANLTVDENERAAEDFSCNVRLFGMNQKIIFSAFNIPLSIVAFLGNVLIISAIQKPSSLHPSSKLLFGCLAITDLCVGLITQPLRVMYLMSAKDSKLCYSVWNIYITLGLIFCGVSLFTVTAISVDRLLALMLGLRYRHIVTLRRVWVIVISFWLSLVAIVIIMFYNFSISASFIVFTITMLCIIISSCCYMKIYFILRKHQAQVQSQVYQGQRNRGCLQQSKKSTPLNIARYKKSVSSALWVQMTLVACYLPFGVIIAIYALSGLNTSSFDLAWESTIVVAMLNSSVNPFIYCWKIKEIRVAVKESINRFC